MGAWLVKRQLTGVGKRLRAMRDELSVIDAGLALLADDAADSGVRSVVSGSGHDVAEHRSDQRHADVHRARRERLVGAISDLERRQDELLDKLSAATRRSSGGGL